LVLVFFLNFSIRIEGTQIVGFSVFSALGYGLVSTKLEGYEHVMKWAW
jgi:hypothetical protein